MTMSGFSEERTSQIYCASVSQSSERVVRRNAEPRRTQFQLVRRFLPRHVQHAHSFSQMLTDLQKQRRLADTRVTAQQNQRAFYKPAAKHTVKFPKPCVKRCSVSAVISESFCTVLRFMLPDAARRFAVGVTGARSSSSSVFPCTASGTLPVPFGRLIPAGRTYIYGFCS